MINTKTTLLIKIVRLANIYALMILIAFLFVFPFLWLLSTALKTSENVYKFPPQIFPWPITFNNFTDVFSVMPLWNYILNSILITSLGITFNLVLSLMIAYPLARINFKGRNLIFFVIVSTMILPNAAGMIVNYLTILKLGLYNSLMAIVLPSAVNVVNIFLLRQAFITIPHELEDSARIDGASEFRIFWNIMIPLVRPAMATVVILEFLNFWNMFIWPIIVLGDPTKYPLTPALQYLQGELTYNFQYVAAGTIISLLPVILVFVVLQRQFINGMVGAIKG